MAARCQMKRDEYLVNSERLRGLPYARRLEGSRCLSRVSLVDRASPQFLASRSANITPDRETGVGSGSEAPPRISRGRRHSLSVAAPFQPRLSAMHYRASTGRVWFRPE